MYKITVLDGGKRNNVVTGDRFTLSKRKAKEFIKLLEVWECEFEILQFRNCGGLWCWSTDNFYYED